MFILKKNYKILLKRLDSLDAQVGVLQRANQILTGDRSRAYYTNPTQDLKSVIRLILNHFNLEITHQHSVPDRYSLSPTSKRKEL